MGRLESPRQSSLKVDSKDIRTKSNKDISYLLKRAEFLIGFRSKHVYPVPGGLTSPPFLLLCFLSWMTPDE